MFTIAEAQSLTSTKSFQPLIALEEAKIPGIGL